MGEKALHFPGWKSQIEGPAAPGVGAMRGLVSMAIVSVFVKHLPLPYLRGELDD
jgi:hypothetical protein